MTYQMFALPLPLTTIFRVLLKDFCSRNMSGHNNLLDKVIENCLSRVSNLFFSHGNLPDVEIEARIRDIDSEVFNYVYSKLDSFPGWTTKKVLDTIDYVHASGTRGTVSSASAPVFIRKIQEERHFDVMVEGHRIRFACSSEESMPKPQPTDPIVQVRRKHRVSFNRKNEFLFELTKTQTGNTIEDATSAPVVCEIEIEWCNSKGNATSAAFTTESAEHMAKSFLMKVSDILQMKEHFEKRRASQSITNTSSASCQAKVEPPISHTQPKTGSSGPESNPSRSVLEIRAGPPSDAEQRRLYPPRSPIDSPPRHLLEAARAQGIIN